MPRGNDGPYRGQSDDHHVNGDLQCQRVPSDSRHQDMLNGYKNYGQCDTEGPKEPG